MLAMACGHSNILTILNSSISEMTELMQPYNMMTTLNITMPDHLGGVEDKLEEGHHLNLNKILNKVRIDMFNHKQNLFIDNKYLS